MTRVVINHALWVPLCMAMSVVGCSQQLSGGIVDDDGELGLGVSEEEDEEEDQKEDEGSQEEDSGQEEDKDNSSEEEPGNDDEESGDSVEPDSADSTGGEEEEDSAETQDSGTEDETEPETESVKGDVEISFETESYRGRFAPHNAGVVWIEHKDGTFLRTLKRWAILRAVHLVRWRAASDSDLTDAITGASLKSHSAHTLKWDRKDHKGKTHGEGDYVLRVEFTEENSDGRAPKGPTLSVPFHLGGGEKTLQPDDVSGYTSVKVVTPD